MMLLKARDYKKAIKQLGMSQVKAATFLGISSRQSRRIAGGHADLTVSAAKLLKVMLHCGLTVKMVNDLFPSLRGPAKKKAKPAATEPAQPPGE